MTVLAVGASIVFLMAQPAARRDGPSWTPFQAGTPGQFRSTVHTVEVHATVRGADGQFVAGLSKDDFELLDNGKRREITVFAGDVQPIAAALVLDRSGSVARQADQIAASAGAFIEGLLPADQASINTLTQECQPLTADKAALRQVLTTGIRGDNGSPVWAGVDNAITSLGGISGRRAILLFSDGDDSGPTLLPPGVGPNLVIGQQEGACHPWTDPSEASLADASRRAVREGIMIYTVSVEGPAVQTHDSDLRAIARGTGGDRYRLRDPGELSAAFGRIVDELHHQYLLGFVPDALDGKVHTLTVRVKRPGVSVRARESYVALDARAPASTVVAAPALLAALTDAEVEQAIRDGMNGQKAQAVCMAVGAFRERPEENQAHADVLLEGPIGRIMHAARDARARRDTLTTAAVTPEMRAPTVLMTAELKTSLRSPGDPMDSFPAQMPVPGSPPQPSGLSILRALRLRSPVLTEHMLRPLEGPTADRPLVQPVPLNQRYRRTGTFDLAAFRAIPGPDVEVIVRSVIGARYCTIAAKERAAIR
jgi:Ca-activated chloride channel family protein